MKIITGNQYKNKQIAQQSTEKELLMVNQIIEKVIKDKDKALFELTQKFDGIALDRLDVTEDELHMAYAKTDDTFMAALRLAAENIRAFHEKQKRTSWMEPHMDGSVLGQMISPLQRVGVYVPGGTAAYPSSVLMNVIPALVAGVEEIVMVTPPGSGAAQRIHPNILVAANELGIKEIYSVGGAQAIAALAYGTETIAPVDKICGPGNIFVALAKQQVYGTVDIDSIAGPTDITVIADETADPSFIAADLLSQAEHDELATAIFITDSKTLAEKVHQQVYEQLETLPRKQIAQTSLEHNGQIIIVESMQEGVDIVNRIAPEHLELMMDEPMQWLGKVQHAGAIFIGPYSSEPVGDYFAGPNHILPTNGTARFSSPLSVDDFVKKSSVIQYSKQALFDSAPYITSLARGEGLEGHARAIEVRLQKEGEKR
ncbi:histidinol dehydrogenase [Longirhabdus pacifica]|uniref:histidinol dehydrogenase n=1 Tax=Longirhabdus pacifica TaxID=2305227 RepID=UPI001008E1B1|nr:histidinol dehydrogenase [Longirhabdus pacifica]